MGQGNDIGSHETTIVRTAVARLEARGVSRRTALRCVARQQGATVRYVRSTIARGNPDWSL